jgi:hypothetical protein
MRDSRLLPTGRLGRTNLRERVEQSAEILISTIGKDIEDSLLERADAAAAPGAAAQSGE